MKYQGFVSFCFVTSFVQGQQFPKKYANLRRVNIELVLF